MEDSPAIPLRSYSVPNWDLFAIDESNGGLQARPAGWKDSLRFGFDQVTRVEGLLTGIPDPFVYLVECVALHGIVSKHFGKPFPEFARFMAHTQGIYHHATTQTMPSPLSLHFESMLVFGTLTFRASNIVPKEVTPWGALVMEWSQVLDEVGVVIRTVTE